MNRRQIALGMGLLFASQCGFSQLKVNTDGQVGIGTNHPVARLHVYGEGLIESHAGPWERAFSTRIHTKNASAYSLWNADYNKEVFFVNGEGWMWSRQGAYVGTDSSLIRNRSSIPSALEKVTQLEGIRFSSGEGMGNQSPNGYHMGLVAQEVEQVVPEAVRTMPDSLLAVSYEELVPLLVEAIKEQQSQISELRMALHGQQEDINKVKNRRWFRKKTIEE